MKTISEWIQSSVWNMTTVTTDWPTCRMGSLWRLARNHEDLIQCMENEIERTTEALLRRAASGGNPEDGASELLWRRRRMDILRVQLNQAQDALESIGDMVREEDRRAEEDDDE